LETRFTADAYDTSEDAPRSLGDRLMLGARWWVAFQIARIVLKSRSRAVRGMYDDERWHESSVEHLRDIEGCGGRFHIRGIDNVRCLREPVVFIGNHMSTVETFVLPCLIVPFRRVTFIVKESLVRHPFFGPIMRSREPIVVGRRNPREDLQAVLKQGPALLTRGISIIVFPQSTRSESFDRSQFNSLGIKLARKAGARVVPMAIKTDFLGNGRILKDFGPVRRDRHLYFEFGSEIVVRGTGEAQHEEILRFIETRLERWKREDELRRKGIQAGATAAS
jgi:1-acyl-sn-glycerol-3-phosphate acyltransferase